MNNQAQPEWDAGFREAVKGAKYIMEQWRHYNLYEAGGCKAIDGALHALDLLTPEAHRAYVEKSGGPPK